MQRMLKFRTLVKAIIITAIFLKGEARDCIMAAITLVWLLANAYSYYKANRKTVLEKLNEFLQRGREDVVEVKVSEPMEECIQECDEDIISQHKQEISEEMQDFLVRNVNFRITEKLKRFYPEATWVWESGLNDFKTNLKNARIRTSNTGKHNLAEVIFLPDGEIHFNMLNVLELGNEEAKEEELSEYDVKTWYDTFAFNTINEIVNEIYSQGYKKMEITQDGSILIKEQNTDVEYGKIDNMLNKKLWNELIRCFKADKIEAKVSNDKLLLSWGHFCFLHRLCKRKSFGKIRSNRT